MKLDPRAFRRTETRNGSGRLPRRSPFIDEDFNGEWQMFTPRPEMRHAALSLANSSLATWWLAHYRVRQRRYRLRGGRQRMRLGPLSETVIINAVNNYKLRKSRKAAPGKTPSVTTRRSLP